MDHWSKHQAKANKAERSSHYGGVFMLIFPILTEINENIQIL